MEKKSGWIVVMKNLGYWKEYLEELNAEIWYQQFISFLIDLRRVIQV